MCCSKHNAETNAKGVSAPGLASRQSISSYSKGLCLFMAQRKAVGSRLHKGTRYQVPHLLRSLLRKNAVTAAAGTPPSQVKTLGLPKVKTPPFSRAGRRSSNSIRRYRYVRVATAPPKEWPRCRYAISCQVLLIMTTLMYATLLGDGQGWALCSQAVMCDSWLSHAFAIAHVDHACGFTTHQRALRGQAAQAKGQHV